MCLDGLSKPCIPLDSLLAKIFLYTSQIGVMKFNYYSITCSNFVMNYLILCTCEWVLLWLFYSFQTLVAKLWGVTISNKNKLTHREYWWELTWAVKMELPETWMLCTVPCICTILAMPTGPTCIVFPFHWIVLTGQDGARSVTSRFQNPVGIHLIALLVQWTSLTQSFCLKSEFFFKEGITKCSNKIHHQASSTISSEHSTSDKTCPKSQIPTHVLTCFN